MPGAIVQNDLELAPYSKKHHLKENSVNFVYNFKNNI